MTENMTEVTKDEFFSVVGPRDIITNCERWKPEAITSWKTRMGRRIGTSITTYIPSPDAGTRYWLIPEYAALRGA